MLLVSLSPEFSYYTPLQTHNRLVFNFGPRRVLFWCVMLYGGTFHIKYDWSDLLYI